MRIAGVTTYRIDALPKLVIVELTTEDGLCGYGDTWHGPDAVEAHIHGALAPALLARAAVSPLEFWRDSFAFSSKSAGFGAEVRALSAIDIALWDLLGQNAGLPIHRLLGGPVADHLPVYNTCAGPTYSRGGVTPGHGSAERSGTLDDYADFLERPGDLARELLSEGYTAMKLWPFDAAAREHGGTWISDKDLAKGLSIVAAIRDAVGDAIDIMIEGHGFWTLPAAQRIARALEPYRPAWIEDLIRSDDPIALRELTSSTSIPTVAGEYLVTRHQMRPLLEARAVSILMFDPGWVGGISESRAIATMAEAYSRPVTLHDCTGPFTLWAGVHVGLASANVVFQETVRSYLRIVYPTIVSDVPVVADGVIRPPSKPGLGTRIRPDLADSPGVSIRTTRGPASPS